MSSTANRVIKNTGYLYAKMAITMFVSLYTTRLILNSLGASDFGIYNIVGGAIAMLGFLNASMASATQRFMSYAEGEGDKEKQKYIFNISVVLHAGIAVFVAIVLLVVGYFFFNGILNIPAERMGAAKVVYLSLIISTLLTVMNVPYDAVMNAHENMRYYALVGILESFLKLAVAFACVDASGDKLIVYGVLMTCIPLFTLSIMKVYCHKHYEECVIKPRIYWDVKLVKEMTTFAGWNFFSAASSMVSQYGLGIVLNNFWGALLNAAQGIANQLSGMLMVFCNTMLKALNPVIAKSKGQGDDALMYKATFSGCKYSYLLLAVFAIPFILEMPAILKLWLKNVPDWAVLFARLQLARSLVEQLTIAISTMISANGKIKTYSLVKSVLSLLPIVLTYIAYSFAGSPASMYFFWILCNGVVAGFFSLYYAKKLCGISISQFISAVIVPCVVITVAMFIGGSLVLTWCAPSLLRIVVTTFITTILFVLFLAVCSTKEERKLVVSIIKRNR